MQMSGPGRFIQLPLLDRYSAYVGIEQHEFP